MPQGQAELIDIDFYCDLLHESEEVEIIQEGELNLHRIIHPRRGFLTAIQGGRYVLLVAGDFHDNRGLPVTAAVYAFGGRAATQTGLYAERGAIIPLHQPPSQSSRGVFEHEQ